MFGKSKGEKLVVIWRERITKGQCAKEKSQGLIFDQVRECEDLGGYLDVSKNSGTPKSSIKKWCFPL